MKKIYIEISDICGLKCSFCPVPKGIRGVMNLELFKKVVAEVSHYTKLITLHILGDPLCVENLGDYLAATKSANLKVEITTSGANLSNLADFDLLLNVPIKQVNFSLDALMELKNKELLLARIVEFCKYKKAIKSQIFVNLRVQKRAQNRDLATFLESEFGVKNLEQYLGESKKRDSRVKLGERIIIDFRGVFEWGDLTLAQDSQCESKNANSKIFDEIVPQRKSANETHLSVRRSEADLRRGAISQKAEFGTCLALKTHIGILSNGEIVPCCMDSQGILSLGNIKDTTLDSALKSKKAQKMLNGFRQNRIVEPFCKVCDYRKRFDSRPNLPQPQK